MWTNDSGEEESLFVLQQPTVSKNGPRPSGSTCRSVLHSLRMPSSTSHISGFGVWDVKQAERDRRVSPLTAE